MNQTRRYVHHISSAADVFRCFALYPQYRVTRQQSSLAKNASAIQASSSELDTDDEIPAKIFRSPTAVLRALESTVGRDESGASYKYIDDPYFIPLSQRNKRDNALAKDSGKRAAHFVMQKYPELFQKMYADPPIESLLPKKLLEIDPQPESFVRDLLPRASLRIPDLPTIVQPLPITIETFRQVLGAGEFASAYRCYDKLRNVKPETAVPHGDVDENQLTWNDKLTLLEGLCFYNSANQPTNDALEERYFSPSIKLSKREPLQQAKWTTNGYADQLFQDICRELTTDTADDVERRTAAYSAMICGTVEYMFHTRANILFEEMLTKLMRPPVQVFNAMIQTALFVRDSSESCWEYAAYILGKMNELNVRPDVLVFNSVLEMLSRSTAWRGAQQCSVMCINEMHRLGIEPSLASWSFLLQTFYRSRSYNHPALAYDVISRLNGQDLWRVRDARDYGFPVETMRICNEKLHDCQLAVRLHALTEYSDNARLFGDAMRESQYYFTYLGLLCDSLPVQEFFEQHYEKLVPRIYTPEPSLIVSIFYALELQGQYRYVSRMWSDAIMFQHANSERAVTAVLEVMTNTPTELLKDESLNLIDGYYHIAVDIRKRYLKNIENEMHRMTRTETAAGAAPDSNMRTGIAHNHTMQAYTGLNLGMVALMLMRCGRYGEAMEMFREFIEDRKSILGTPAPAHLRELAEACISKHNMKHLRVVGDYIKEQEMSEVAEDVRSFITNVAMSDDERAVMMEMFRA